MSQLGRILSRPVAKPYRNHHLAENDKNPKLDDNGHVTFSDGDPENPKNWSTKRRSYVTICGVLLVVNATFASSSPSGCLPSIAEWFSVSHEAASLTITLFLLGYCAGPLIFAPLSEVYGRRPIFYITFLLYIVFNFLCAFAPNFAALLIGRFLTGTFVSAPLSNSPGLLADIWGPVQRSNAMAGFAAMVWAGPALGPVISGFIQLKLDWRWSFYVLLWLGAITSVFMFTIPETYAPVVLKHKAKRIRAAKNPGLENLQAPIEANAPSLGQIFKVALTRPWIILFDPISFACAVYMAFVYMLLYMLFGIYPIIFQQHRGWNAGVGELPLIGTVIGAIVGAIGVLYDSRRLNKKMLEKDGLKPEDRLVLAMVGGVGFAACMFWLAWSGNYDYVHWIVPTLAGLFLSASMLLIFVSFLNYLVDVYLMYAASAIAANTVLRSACGAAAPLFIGQMFDALGVGPGGSLLGGVATILAVIPFLFYKYGETLRNKSKFSPTGKKNTPPPAEKRPASDEEQARGGDADQEAETSSTEVADDERSHSPPPPPRHHHDGSEKGHGHEHGLEHEREHVVSTQRPQQQPRLPSDLLTEEGRMDWTIGEEIDEDTKLAALRLKAKNGI